MFRGLPATTYRGEENVTDYEDLGVIPCRFVDRVVPDLESPTTADREVSTPTLYGRLSDGIKLGDRVTDIQTRRGAVLDDRTYEIESVRYQQRFSNEVSTLVHMQLKRTTGV